MISQLTLQSKTITGRHPGPHLLIIGGVHGDEFEAMSAIRRLMRELNPQEIYGRVTLVPVVNEGAFMRRDRTAEDGLDLARTCPGRADGSITEQVAFAVSELIKSADYFIDLHSGGNAMRVFPLVGYGLHPDPKILDEQRRMAKAFNLPVVWGTTPHLNGRTLSVARDYGVPAIYAEWMGAGLCDRAGVEAYVEGCLHVMSELRMLDREPSPPIIEYEIEDAREQSGHLQINYPAPMRGFFETSLKLGKRVEVGDTIGTVTDSLGEQTVPVLSTQTGLLLCLRAYSQVDEGDCLAVILELDGPASQEQGHVR